MGKTDTNPKHALIGVPQTYIVQALGVIFGVLFLKFASAYLTLDDFGALMVARRWIGFIAPLLTLNLAISLARNTGMNPGSARSYLFLTLSLSGALFTLLLLFGYLFPSHITRILWNNSAYQSILVPVIVLTGITSLQIIAVAYWRGIQKFGLMNAGTFVFRFLPIVVLFIVYTYFENSFDVLIYYFIGLGLLLGVYNGGVLVFTNSIKASFKAYDTQGFIQYGIKRLPGSLYYLAFFWLPVFFATLAGDLETAAFIGVIIAVINLFSLAATPASLIILPKFAQISSRDEKRGIAKKSNNLIEFIFQVPILLGPLVFLFSTELIHFWFGPQFYPIISPVKVISLGISGLMVYIFLRSVVDGIESKPLTNHAAFAGVLSMIASTGVSIVLIEDLVMAISIGLCIGMVALAIMILYLLNRSIENGIDHSKLMGPVFLLVLVYSLSFLVSLITFPSIYTNLLFKIVVSGLLLVTLFLFYRRRGPEWLKLVMEN